MMVQVRLTSELLGLEHGNAQIEEHHDGQREKDSLGPGHTRSRAQMSPSITTTNPTMPSTARTSAMGPWWRRVRQRDVNAVGTRINKMSIVPGGRLALG